jgi:hypothetical protein
MEQQCWAENLAQGLPLPAWPSGTRWPGRPGYPTRRGHDTAGSPRCAHVCGGAVARLARAHRHTKCSGVAGSSTKWQQRTPDKKGGGDAIPHSRASVRGCRRGGLTAFCVEGSMAWTR